LRWIWICPHGGCHCSPVISAALSIGRFWPPRDGLPGDKDIGGPLAHLGYVLLRLNRAPLPERYPVTLASLIQVDELCQQLTTQAINCTMPVIQADHYARSAASVPVWVCWLDRTQFERATLMTGASSALIVSSYTPADNEHIVLPSGEHMGGFHLLGGRALAHPGPLQRPPNCHQRLMLGCPAPQTASAPAAPEEAQVPGDRQYRKLFPLWVETPEIAAEGRVAQRRDGIPWQIAATPDDFSRAGQATVLATRADAAQADLKEGQLVVVRPALFPEHGAKLAALAHLKVIDQTPDLLPPEYRYLQADQIVRDAVGIEIGEIAVITPCKLRRRSGLFDRIIGAPAYVTCRVQSADATTIEREVGLVDELTLQTLGVESGDAVVIEGLPNVDGGITTVPWLRIKVFQTSGEVLLRRTHLSGGDLTSRFPTARDSLGTFPDLPWVFLDSSARMALGLSGQNSGLSASAPAA
jgi:hypothetical protein